MSEATKDVQGVLNAAGKGEAVTVKAPDAYDLAMSDLAGFGLCDVCEEEIVVGKPGERALCAGCQGVDNWLRWRYETRDVARVKPTVEPRLDCGIAIYTEGDATQQSFIEYAEPRNVVGVMVAASGLVFTVFCLIGWYGLRLLTQVGIWMAR